MNKLNRTHLSLLLLLAGCGPTDLRSPTPVLNSERIAAVYGSYGVELLAQSNTERSSCLYSETESRRICRTLAVVLFAPDADARLPGPMQAIRAGGSLGATLQSAGWSVAKRNRWIGDVDLDQAAAPAVMRYLDLHRPERLAVHVYDLEAVRADDRLPVATVIEAHHPDYLDARDLRRIYGRLPTAVSTVAEREGWQKRLTAIAARP